ncbi:MAG: calcium-binding protein [Nitrococcus sp.]|nr:calcium-binding protein [Nitrococcus sp.]
MPAFLQTGSGLVFGTDESEVIQTDGPSVVYAGGGDDGVRMGYQQDVAFLGGGNDTVYTEDGSDLVFGEAGNDFIYTGAGNDWADGGLGNDFLWGSDGADQLFGNEGDDLINGENGIDALYGSLGNDTVLGGAGSDVIFGGEGDDLALGGADGDWISGGSGHNQVYGEGGDDVIYGNYSGDPETSNEIFYTGSDGKDWIGAFVAETDQLMIAADINGTGIDAAADFDAARVSDHGTVGEEDAGALVDLGGDNSILLVGVAASDVIANSADYFTVA